MDYRHIVISQSAIAIRVGSASSFAERLRGLIGAQLHSSIDALRIAPCFAIHTLAMSAAVDVVFVGADRRILRVVEGLRPWRMAVSWDASEVWEFRHGAAAQLRLQYGTLLPW